MSLGGKWILSLVEAKNKMAQSKLIKKSITDKEAYIRSVKPLGKLDCQRIIAGHGHIIEGAAGIKEGFRGYWSCLIRSVWYEKIIHPTDFSRLTRHRRYTK